MRSVCLSDGVAGTSIKIVEHYSSAREKGYACKLSDDRGFESGLFEALIGFYQTHHVLAIEQCHLLLAKSG